MRISTPLVFSSVCVISGVVLVSASTETPLPVVPNVDLKKYQGKWFEIARRPARFERDCARDVTAEYALRHDGRLDVVNSCRDEDGELKSSRGIARLKDANGPSSKLKVRFFWPFEGDYWIVDIDPDYKWSLVGTPDRRYMWILSRTPSLSEQVYERIAARARELGFNVDRLIRTKQTA